MRFLSEFKNIVDFIQLEEPIKFDGYEAVGFFPYSIASISPKVPKVPRKLFQKLEDSLGKIMDNKIVVIFRDLENFGTDDFAIQFHDCGCRVGKLEDVVRYGGGQLTHKI